MPATVDLTGLHKQVSAKTSVTDKNSGENAHLLTTKLSSPPPNYNPLVDFLEEGVIGLIWMVEKMLEGSRNFMANIAISLHNKMRGAGRIHDLMVVWTEIQQTMIMQVQAGTDINSSSFTVASIKSKGQITDTQINGWFTRLVNLGAFGSSNTPSDLEAYTYSEVVDAKDAAQQNSTSSQALTDEKRTQLQSTETNYSTAATLLSSIIQAFKAILMSFARMS